MIARPILFSAPMVRALLDGSKTQTRRVLKRQPDEHHWQLLPGYELKQSKIVTIKDRLAVKFSHSIPQNPQWDTALDWLLCPYGQPGDRLWVRETWQGPLLEEFESDADSEWMSPSRIHQYQNPAHCQYAADGGPAPEFMDADDNLQRRWRPSIHMPRWASRITLEIVSVRVERLQDISQHDAMAEGYHLPPPPCLDDPRKWYRHLWEQINGPGSWDANPWVWCVEFRRLP